MTRQPKLEKLSERQSRIVLRRHHAGRLAFAFKDRVDIEPIGYVLDGDWLYGRTSLGTKLIQVTHNPWVAFEVDEIAGPFDWTSVVVHGTVYFLNAAGERHPDFDHAVGLLRRLEPRTLGATDPAPRRTTIFRIHMNEISGRRARLSGSSTEPAAARRRDRSAR